MLKYISKNPVDDFGLQTSGVLYSATLASATATSITVPGLSQRLKMVVKIDGSSSVWMAVNNTASVPAGSSFAQTTSELINPGINFCREVVAGQSISFITSGTNVPVSISFYTYGN